MISVVIPLYNKELSIGNTLRSVLNQTYKDYEIVVVDDGSTDNSAAVVAQLAQTDNRIKLISQTNSGVSAARNRGIAESKGEYVVFLDADDIWEPDFLYEMHRLIVDFPNATLFALGLGSMSQQTKSPCKCDLPNKFRGYIHNVWLKNPTFLSSSSCCCCKNIIVEIGGFDTRMTHGEDYDMWWRLIFEGALAFYNKTLAYYVQDAENRAMNRVIPLDKHIPYYIDKYEEQRKKNSDFRKFCDEECARRLYPYLFDKQYRNDAKKILKKIDWTLLKKSLYWRMKFPYSYRLYMKIKGNK